MNIAFKHVWHCRIPAKLTQAIYRLHDVGSPDIPFLDPVTPIGTSEERSFARFP